MVATIAARLSYRHAYSFSVTDAMRNISLKDGVLPPNPSWVVINESDGDARRWPTNTTEVVDAEGQVNFMQPLPIDHPAAIKWRITCGAAIAELLKYPNARELVTSCFFITQN